MRIASAQVLAAIITIFSVILPRPSQAYSLVLSERDIKDALALGQEIRGSLSRGEEIGIPVPYAQRVSDRNNPAISFTAIWFTPFLWLAWNHADEPLSRPQIKQLLAWAQVNASVGVITPRDVNPRALRIHVETSDGRFLTPYATNAAPIGSAGRGFHLAVFEYGGGLSPRGSARVVFVTEEGQMFGVQFDLTQLR
jgi:hypothetical protein